MPTTQRLLTDVTGQALVTAVNNIVAAVKPNATEIQMSSSDTTTVAEAISTTNQALSNINTAIAIEEISSSTSLATLIDNMTGYSQRHYFSVNKSRITDYPQVLIDSGANNYVTIYIEKRSATLARIKITASTSSDECVTAEGLFYNGTFYWSQLALNSKISTSSPSFDYTSTQITTNACRIKKCANVVSVYITMITSGNVSSNEKILTLPSGARPVDKIVFYIYNGAGQIGIQVDTNGEITALSSISNQGWCYGICTFVVN